MHTIDQNYSTFLTGDGLEAKGPQLGLEEISR